MKVIWTQDDLKEGDLVAVMPDEEEFAGQPWIGQCLSELNGDTIKCPVAQRSIFQTVDPRPQISTNRYSSTDQHSGVHSHTKADKVI